MNLIVFIKTLFIPTAVLQTVFGQLQLEQKKVQPPSFTGAGGIYTDNESFALGIMQQNYWNEDRWRFNASAGYGDFKLELVEPVAGNDSHQVDWLNCNTLNIYFDGYSIRHKFCYRFSLNHMRGKDRIHRPWNIKGILGWPLSMK